MSFLFIWTNRIIYMLGLVLLAIGVVGFGLGGYLDLRSTEFPDWLPYSMIILALASRGIYSYFVNDFSFLINSVFAGTGFLVFGLLLYYMRQWGDGDAWMLGALGFLFPDSAGFSPFVESSMPFPMTMFFNFFIIALFYLIGYALIIGLKSPKIYPIFIKNIRGNAKSILSAFSGLMIISLSMAIYFWQSFSVPLYNFSGILLVPFMVVLLLMFLQYARAVEGNLFKKKIPVNKLKVGDVLADDKWRGLTEKEVEKLKKKGGYVLIKEGVRFAPVFVINFLVTLFYGSLFGIFLIL